MTVPYTPRPERLRRLRGERETEFREREERARAESAETAERGTRFAETAAAFDVEAPEAPEVVERPLGPRPREGMRPSRRPATVVDRSDPFAAQSQLERSLASLRYRSIATPLLGTGQTVAKILRTGYGLAGKIPVVGAPFRALEQDLEERIQRDEAKERTVRERYMSGGERLAQDLARFGVEFETGTRAFAPALRAAPLLRAAPEGASLPARFLTGAGRVGTRAAAEGSQFGLYETGKSLASGESLEEAAIHGREGAAAGAVFGGGLRTLGEVGPPVLRGVGRLLRPVAEGVEAVPGAVRETLRTGARDVLVADAMAREAVGGVRKRLSGVTGRIRRRIAEAVSPELASEASRDPLTGALNRRADVEASEHIITKRERGTRIVRLRADLDNFKALNDARGHEAGDQALQRVTEAWKQAARAGDVIDTPGAARVGGDEFGATLKIGEHADPEAIARRFEAAANEALREAGLHEAGGKGVGVSVGWAEHGAGGAKELDAAADAAAAARKKGRGVSKPREGGAGQPEPPPRVPESRPPEEGHRATPDGEIARPGASSAAESKAAPSGERRFVVEEGPLGTFSIRDRQRDALTERGTKKGELEPDTYSSAEAAQRKADEYEGGAKIGEEHVQRREGRKRKQQPQPAPGTKEPAQEQAPKPGVMERVKANDGTEYTLSYREPRTDPTTGRQLDKGGYFVTFESGGAEGGRGGIATEAEARQVLGKFVEQANARATTGRPAAPPERPAGSGDTQGAFDARVNELLGEKSDWAGKGQTSEDLQALSGLESALESTGFKLEGGEFSSRFRELISQMHTGLTGTRADKPASEYVRILDERLANAGAGRYDVSRYRGDNRPVEQIQLPADFDLSKWREGKVPPPEHLRGETGWGEPINLLFRRLETASARATRDADMLEALGAPKDAPGVTRARNAATAFVERKAVLEQQAERAVTLAERYHSIAATHRAASLNRDIGAASIRPSDWIGDRMEPGEFVSDGHILIRRVDLDQLPAGRRKIYERRNEKVAGAGAPQVTGKKIFDEAVKDAKQKLELLGHLPRDGAVREVAYLVPEGKNEGLRRVNAGLLRRLKDITKFDELRGPTDTDRAIVAYRDGEPVGVIMPFRSLADELPFSVEQARRLAGQKVQPPKRSGGSTTASGLRVHEPATVRTPMEPNFEEPLASASLPAAARPSMTGTGADVVARSRIVRKMAEILNIPVRIGKYGGFSRGTLGIYKIKPEAVRLKVAKDVEVLGHEVGHHIHKLFFGTAPRGLSSQVLRPWVKELKPLGKGISDQSSAEGLAEFFRRFLTNPPEAEKAAPTFFKYVNDRLAAEFPELRSMFDEARSAYKTYLEATPEARVASNISTQPTKSWSFPEKFRRFMADIVSDMYDIEQAQREIISSALGLDAPPRWRVFARARWMAELNRQTRWEENAAALAHLVRGSAGTAEHFVRRGTLDHATLQVKGKGLEAILRPVSKQFDEFLHYAVSRRVMELKGRGIETGIRPEDASAVVEQYLSRKHFVSAFDDLQVYQRHLLEYLRDAGVLSGDTFERILAKNEHYLPFYRVLDDETARRAGSGSVFGKLFSPVKRIKGSGRDIINPFESIVKNTYLYTRLAARQRVAQALARLAERDGAGVWIEQIPTPTNVTKFTFGEIENRLQKILGERLNLEDLSPVEAMRLGEEMLAVYRPGDYFGKDNIISVLRGDKRVWYDVDPDLYKAMMALNHEQAGMMTRLLTFPAKLLRYGATLSLEFIARNPIRDQLAAFVQSEYGFKPGFDWARGLFHMVRRDDLFWKWKAAGGERASLLELDRDSLGKAVRDVLGRPPGAGEILKDVVKSPIELLKLLSAAAEDATRIGEFARGVEVAGTTRAGLERAALASREVSVDFARHGAKTEAVRLMTAFWNARLQGHYRLYRSMRDHPVRTSYRAGVAVTMPSVLLFYANKDDPEYWAKPQWERDLFWHVKIGGTFYRIPKPFELGIVFGTIPERILEWAHTQDPEGLEKSLVTLANDAAALVPLPTTLVPLLENFGNWSLFKRQPIESRPLQEVQPEFRFTEGTSDIARGMGKMLGYSPQKIDNLMFGWTGGLGRLAVDLGDIGGQQVGLFPEEARPSKTAADIPGVRGFVSKPAGRGSEDVERFYDVWSEAREAKSTHDLLDREDRFDELDTFEGQNSELLDRYDDLKGYADELAALRHEIAEIGRDESLTPDQRRQEVEQLGSEMQQIAAEAIERRTPASARRP